MGEVFVDEIDLTLAGDLRGFSDAGRTARVDDGALDDAEPAAVHGVLGRGGRVLHDVAVFSHEFLTLPTAKAGGFLGHRTLRRNCVLHVLTKRLGLGVSRPTGKDCL